MNMLFLGTEAKKTVFYDVLYVPKLTCSLFFLQTAVAKGNAVELALMIAASGMKMESFVERGHLLINSINLIVKLFLLGTPQLRHLVATCGINV